MLSIHIEDIGILIKRSCICNVRANVKAPYFFDCARIDSSCMTKCKNTHCIRGNHTYTLNPIVLPAIASFNSYSTPLEKRAKRHFLNPLNDRTMRISCLRLQRTKILRKASRVVSMRSCIFSTCQRICTTTTHNVCMPTFNAQTTNC